MVDIQTISIAIASAGVFVAAVYYIIQIRHQTKLRKTDLILRMWQPVCTEEMARAWNRLMSAEYDDFDDFVEKYGYPLSENPVPIAFSMLSMVYEGLGVSLHRKIVDADLIREYFPVGAMWRKMRPVIEGLRKQRNSPGYLLYFEYLYNELKKREQKLQQEGAKNG